MNSGPAREDSQSVAVTETDAIAQEGSVVNTANAIPSQSSPQVEEPLTPNEAEGATDLDEQLPVYSNYYRISKEGFPDSYLFGTCHRACTQYIQNLLPHQSVGFKEAQRVLMEQSPQTVIDFSNNLLQRALDSEYDLRKILGEELYHKLEKYFLRIRDAGMPFYVKLEFGALLYSDEPFYTIDIHRLMDLIVFHGVITARPVLLNQFQEKVEQLTFNEEYTFKFDCPFDLFLEKKIEEIARKEEKEIIILDSLPEIPQDCAVSEAEASEFKSLIADLLGGGKGSKWQSYSQQSLIKSVNNIHEQLDFLLGYQFNIPMRILIDDESFLNMTTFEISHEINSNNELVSKLPRDVVRSVFWMENILDSIESFSTFIAVGAAHLHGTCGLVELLQHFGFAVTPLECPLQSSLQEQSAASVPHITPFRFQPMDLSSEHTSTADRPFTFGFTLSAAAAAFSTQSAPPSSVSRTLTFSATSSAAAAAFSTQSAPSSSTRRPFTFSATSSAAAASSSLSAPPSSASRPFTFSVTSSAAAASSSPSTLSSSVARPLTFSFASSAAAASASSSPSTPPSSVRRPFAFGATSSAAGTSESSSLHDLAAGIRNIKLEQGEPQRQTP